MPSARVSALTLASLLWSCGRSIPPSLLALSSPTTSTPLEAGRAVLEVRAVLENRSADVVELVGVTLHAARPNGPASAVQLEPRPRHLAGHASAELSFRVQLAPPAAAGEAIFAEIELLAHSEGRWLSATSPRAEWIVAPATGSAADTDGDGISDADERLLGTSAALSDSDGDLMPDGDEIGGDPAAPRDSDGDGAIDALDPDSDMGGEPDRAEYLAGRNPYDPADDLVGSPLLVTTAEDELDGGPLLSDVGGAGGPGDLSLREAITIANNRGGPDTITFDAALFPREAPVTIQVGGGSAGVVPLPDIADAGTVLDATGAGVILDGGAGSRALLRGLHVTGRDVRIAGVTLQYFSGALDQGGSAVSAQDTDGIVLDRLTAAEPVDRYGSVAVRLTSVNRFAVAECTLSAEAKSLMLVGSADGLVLGNDLHSNGGGDFGIWLELGTLIDIRANAIRRCNSGIRTHFSSEVTIEGNVIENQAQNGIYLEHTDGARITANTIRYNVSNGLWIASGSSQISILSNIITMNGDLGIADIAAPPQPVIDGYDGSLVTGTDGRPDSSLVELFVDGDAEGALLVGSGALTGGVFAVPVSLPALLPGRQLTVTVTDTSGHTSPFSAPWSF